VAGWLTALACRSRGLRVFLNLYPRAFKRGLVVQGGCPESDLQYILILLWFAMYEQGFLYAYSCSMRWIISV
jgi:hypothetical protein